MFLNAFISKYIPLQPLRYEEFGITSLLRHSALDISSDLRVVSLELEKLAEFSRYWVSLRKLVKYLTSPVDNDIKIRLRNAHHLAVNEWRGSGALGNLATYLEVSLELVLKTPRRRFHFTLLQEHPTNLCRFKRSAKQVLYMMYMACTLGQLRGYHVRKSNPFRTGSHRKRSPFFRWTKMRHAASDRLRDHEQRHRPV